MGGNVVIFVCVQYLDVDSYPKYTLKFQKAFLSNIFQKMLYNGYMHPKSIFLLTDVVSTSVYGCLKLIYETKYF